jgi:hypothetical protein
MVGRAEANSKKRYRCGPAHSSESVRKSGYVFCTDTNEPLDQSNILKLVLHPIRIGDENTPGIVVNINDKPSEALRLVLTFSAVSVTRTCVRPTCLLACSSIGWGTAASRIMSDVYDKSAEDAAWRAEIAEQIGTGFTVPSCTNCTEKKKRRLEPSPLRN